MHFKNDFYELLENQSRLHFFIIISYSVILNVLFIKGLSRTDFEIDKKI